LDDLLHCSIATGIAPVSQTSRFSKPVVINKNRLGRSTHVATITQMVAGAILT
jgi:hypothetical protein